MVRLADRLEHRTQWAYELRLLATAQGLAESVIGELDFESEARNLGAMEESVRVAPAVVLLLVRVAASAWVTAPLQRVDAWFQQQAGVRPPGSSESSASWVVEPGQNVQLDVGLAAAAFVLGVVGVTAIHRAVAPPTLGGDSQSDHEESRSP